MQNQMIIALSAAEFSNLLQSAVQAGVREVLATGPQKSKIPNQPEYHSRGEVAKLLGVSIGTINNRVKDGTLRTVRVGGRVLIHSSELERIRFEHERKIRA